MAAPYMVCHIMVVPPSVLLVSEVGSPLLTRDMGKKDWLGMKGEKGNMLVFWGWRFTLGAWDTLVSPWIVSLTASLAHTLASLLPGGIVASCSNLALLTSANWRGVSFRLRKGCLVAVSAGAVRARMLRAGMLREGMVGAFGAAQTSFLVKSLVCTKSLPLATAGPWASAPMRVDRSGACRVRGQGSIYKNQLVRIESTGCPRVAPQTYGKVVHLPLVEGRSV